MLNQNGMINGANHSAVDAPTPRQPSPVDTMLQELFEMVCAARAEVQGLVNQLEPVRAMAPRADDNKKAVREAGACKTEESLLESIAGLRGMIESIRDTKAELRVW